MVGEKKKKTWKEVVGALPKEIEEEILVQLPVKSLTRFKAVSKEWRGTIESNYFIERHKRYQQSLKEVQLMIVGFIEEEIFNGLAIENMLVSSSGIVHVSPPYQSIRSFNRFDGYKISEPCDGLICLYTFTPRFNIVNPATTSRRELPNPPTFLKFDGENRVCTLAGIGRENSVSSRYKLMWYFEGDKNSTKESTRCMVFALGSNTWRYVVRPHCRVHYHHPLIHLDGVMYCFMEKESHFEKELKLLAFDLYTEKFQSILITPDIECTYSKELSMCVLNHRVCIFKKFVNARDLFFNIWGLDVDKRCWEIKYSIDLTCFPQEFKESRIIPMATINNYLIISNSKRTTWFLYNSKTSNLTNFYGTSSPFKFVRSYFETLVEPYQ